MVETIRINKKVYVKSSVKPTKKNIKRLRKYGYNVRKINRKGLDKLFTRRR